MLRIGFAGTFSARLHEFVQARLDVPCDIIVADEVGIVPELPRLDVLVPKVFTREMAGAYGIAIRRRPDRPCPPASRSTNCRTSS